MPPLDLSHLVVASQTGDGDASGELVRRFQDMAVGYTTIAAFLDLSAATVNNRLRSARRHLKEELLQMAEKQLEDSAPSRSDGFAERVRRLTRPQSMDTNRYVGALDSVDGHDAWSLFCAAAAGDLRRVRALVDRDSRLVNAQHWYQFPIHMAVREGHADVVQLLLESGADPGLSNFLYDSWDKLLAEAQRRTHGAVERLLAAAMAERFGYDPTFEPLREALCNKSLLENYDLSERNRNRSEITGTKRRHNCLS